VRKFGHRSSHGNPRCAVSDTLLFAVTPEQPKTLGACRRWKLERKAVGAENSISRRRRLMRVR
jgi:hypothetical protein